MDEYNGCNRELKFTVIMSIQKMNPQQDKIANELFQAGLDEKVLLDVINRNRVWPIVQYNMKRLHLIDNAIYQSVSQSANKCAIVNMKLAGALARIFRKFEEKNVEALVLKGPVLSQMIYGNIAMRSSKDLDLLVRQEQFLEAVDALEEIGFHCMSAYTTPKRRKYILAHEKKHDFAMWDGTTEVELHWRADHFSGLSFDVMDDNKMGFQMCGVEVYAPNMTANLYYLIQHGMRHSFLRLGWLTDIYELLQNKDTLYRQELRSFFAERKSEYIFQAMLMLLNSTGLTDYETVGEKSEMQAAQLLHDKVWAVISAEDYEERRARRAEFSSAYDKELRMRGLIQTPPVIKGLNPDVHDFEAINLPDSLFFLYYPFRWIYWIWRHTPFYKGRHKPDTIKNIVKRQ